MKLSNRSNNNTGSGGSKSPDDGAWYFLMGGVEIPRDDFGMVGLNAIWRAAGQPPNREPSEWGRLPQGKAVIHEVAAFLSAESSRVWKIKRGRYTGGVWAHWRIAVRYGEYLSPEYDRHIESAAASWAEEVGNPALKFERGVAMYLLQGKTLDWTMKRMRGIAVRCGLTEILASHGVTGDGYATCTNATYRALFGGTPASLKAQRGLKKSASLRDHFNGIELTSTELAEQLAAELIEKMNSQGVDPCANDCRTAASAVAQAIATVRQPPQLPTPQPTSRP